MTTYRKSMSEALNQVYLGEDNMALLKKAAGGAMQTLKMKDGKVKMDSFTASAIMQVYKAINPKNKKTMENVVNTGTISALQKLQSLAMRAIKSGDEVEHDGEELDEAKLNIKKIHKAVDDGKSMDVIVGMFADRRTTNTDEIRKIVRDYKFKKRMKEEVELDEAKYDLYHKDFSSAMQHAYSMAKKLYGITIDPKEIDDKVATGPSKPGSGKTNKYRLKGDKGAIQVQVYNKGGSKPFELNMYKEEVELDESVSVKDFDSLKKGDTVTIQSKSVMGGSKEGTYKVTGKNVVGKDKVEKVTLKNVKNPGGVKYFLYKRDNKVSFAQGDMGASVVSFKKEEVELDEAVKIGDTVTVKLNRKGREYIEKGKVIKVEKDSIIVKHDFSRTPSRVSMKNIVKEEVELDESKKALKAKSEKSGVSVGILSKVYDRGMAAWKTGHRPGTTPQQWALARVNSFLTGGGARKADNDLWQQAKKQKKEDLDKKDEPVVQKVVKMLKKASNAHAGQAKDLEKAIKEQPEHEITVGGYTTKHFYMCGTAQEVMKKNADVEGAEEITKLQDDFYKLEKDVMDAGSATDGQKILAKEIYNKIMELAGKAGLADDIDDYMKQHIDSIEKGDPKPGFGRTDIKEDLDEGKMSQLHQLMKDGKSAKEIAKIMKLDVKTIKALVDEQLKESSARRDAMRSMRKDKEIAFGPKGLHGPIDPADIDDIATDDDVKAASKNIMMQMRKVISLRGNFKVEFGDKKKMKIDPKIASAVQNKYDSIKRPIDKQKFTIKIAKSYKDMLSALKEGFASDAQRRAAFASGYKEKGKKKKEEIVKEGTWGLPDTPELKAGLKKLMKKPIPLGKDGDDAIKAIGKYIGDDGLYDDLYDAGKKDGPKADARPVISGWMDREFVGSWKKYRLVGMGRRHSTIETTTILDRIDKKVQERKNG